MRRTTRWWLKGTLRALNMAVNVTGVAMIIYSLWLLKKWDDGVSELPFSSISTLPKPWFIWTCLGVGMVVCFSTLCGYMAVHHTKDSIPCLYIATLFSLVLLQGGVIITIFFNMDLESEIIQSIDDTHAKFKNFLLLHLCLCRYVTIAVVVAQVNLVILAATLGVLGAEPGNNTRSHLWAVPDFRYSFLISPNSHIIHNDTDFIICEDVEGDNTPRTTRSKVLRFLFGC